MLLTFRTTGARLWCAVLAVAVVASGLVLIGSTAAQAVGGVTWVPTSVPAATSGVSAAPRVVITQTRRAIAAWVSSGSIKAASLDPVTNTWTSIGNITNSNVSGNQIPGMVVLPDGKIVAVWRSSLNSSGTNGSVRSASLAPGGTVWSPAPPNSSIEVGLDAFSGSSAIVTVDAAGRLVAAWRKLSGNGLMSAVSEDNGASWSAAGELPNPTSSSGIWPVTLAPLSDGQVMAGAMTATGVVQSARLPAGGTSWTAVADAATDGKITTSAMVGAQPDGTTVLVYRSSSGSVKARKLALNGSSWTALPDLGTGSSASVSPGVALNPLTGAMVASWIDSGSGEYQAAYLPVGASAWTPFGSPAIALARMQPGMSVDPVDGSALAVWWTSANPTNGVKAARSQTPPGPPLTGNCANTDQSNHDHRGNRLVGGARRRVRNYVLRPRYCDEPRRALDDWSARLRVPWVGADLYSDRAHPGDELLLPSPRYQ